MHTEGLLENNSIYIAGKIIEECEFSHEVYGEGFYLFKISSERLSDNEDILPITGQLRSYNNYGNKKNKLVLTIFAREINLLEEDTEQNPNQIFLNGFICKPPVYRKTPFGREICDILVAVNRAYNKSDYIPCIAWGRNARYLSNLSVGENIKIWGRVQSRKYQKKVEDTVEERIAYEVSISKIEVASDKREKQKSMGNHSF